MAIDSDKIIRLGATEPPNTTTRDAERKTLAQQVAEYLAKGGVIEDATGKSGIYYPPRRTRQAQINFIKNRDYKRRKKNPMDN